MSFGNQAYQHRFYDNSRSRQIENQSPILSLKNITVNEVSRNDLNNKVRASRVIKQNEPGWLGFKITEKIVNQYSEDYEKQREILEKFQKQAEQYKKKKKGIFRIKENSIENRRYKTQQKQQTKMESSIIYENPQSKQQFPKIISYDVGIMTNLQRALNKSLINSRITTLEEQKVKSKYQKLKSKVKEGKMLKKMKEIAVREVKKRSRHESRPEEDNKSKLQDMTKMMKNINEMIYENSKILQKSKIIFPQKKKQTIIYEQPFEEKRPNKIHNQFQINDYRKFSERQKKEHPKVIYNLKRRLSKEIYNQIKLPSY